MVEVAPPAPGITFAGDKPQVAPLGTPDVFIPLRHGLRGGMMERVYQVKFPKQTLRVWTYEMPNGKLEQYQVAPE